MTQEEKNLRTWRKASGLPTPNLADLQAARSRQCRPEHIHTNLWQTPSTTRKGVFYSQEVFFAGYCDARIMMNEITPEFSHGFLLHVECNCPSVKLCKHAIAVQLQYEANYGFLFDLFGLDRSSRFADLYGKAHETYLRLKENQLRRAA